jgi:type II secretory pathway pseudopilin PulG
MLELVIVVVILGIIAAIAVPRMTSASTNAMEARAIADLRLLREAMELFKEEHGFYPGQMDDGQGGGAEEWFERQLTQFSMACGYTAPTPESGYIFGPYIRTIPQNPFKVEPGDEPRAVAVVNGHAAAASNGGGEGWVVNIDTGQIVINSDGHSRAGARLDGL